VLRIRLRREGSRNRPFFRVVVSESRRTPTGPTVDTLGYYDPKLDPPAVELDLDRYQTWVDQGAHPSDTVRSLVKKLRAAAPTVAEP